jgi:hypothetical protein
VGSAVKSLGSVFATTSGAGGGGLFSDVLGGLGPKYTDTDALQGISNQQQAGAADAQAQLNALAPQRSQFGQALANQALGKAPSIADAQLKMAMDRNLSQQISAAKANRAVNPALAARNNVQQANQMAQQTAQQAAVNRLAEQQANQQAFGQYLAQQQNTGAGYLGGAGTTQSGVMNTQFANQQRGINMFKGLAEAGMQGASMMKSDKDLKTLVKKYNKGGMVKKSKVPAYCGPEKMADGGLVSASNSIANVVGGAGVPDDFADKEGMQQSGQDWGKFLSSLKTSPTPMDATGVGGIELGGPMMVANKGGTVPGKAQVPGDSEKNDIVPALLSPGEIVVPRTVVNKGSKAVAKFVAETIRKEKGSTDKVQKKSDGGKVDEFNPKSFLDALQATSFEYKKEAKGLPGAGEGRRLGIMAQDLEKAGPVGKSMVKDTPTGKQVDMGVGFGAILAAQSSLNERLKQLETKWGKK